MPAAPSPAAATRRGARRAAGSRRRRGITARAAILLAVIAAIVFLSIAPARLYAHQRAELAALERRAAAIEAGNARLAARAERLRDADYLEGLARRCLGMVRTGEVAFVVVPKHGAPTPPGDC